LTVSVQNVNWGELKAPDVKRISATEGMLVIWFRNRRVFFNDPHVKSPNSIEKEIEKRGKVGADMWATWFTSNKDLGERGSCRNPNTGCLHEKPAGGSVMNVGSKGANAKSTGVGGQD